MAGKKKTPQIRIDGFTKDWNEGLLNQYLETSLEKNLDEVFSREDVLSVSGDYGVVNQIEFQGRSFAGASVANYGVVHTGDVVYTKSPLKDNPYGIIKTNAGKPGIVSTLYAIYHPLETTYPEFVQWYFENNDRLNRYLNPLVNKGAKNDMKVSSDNALLGTVFFPEYDEQEAISNVLSCIQNMILQYEAKLSKLHTFRESMLDKMFPKNDAEIPEIRFNGFSDGWKNYSFSRITYPSGTKNKDNIQYESYSITNEKGFVPQNEQFENGGTMKNADKRMYIIVEPNSFAYNPARINVGSIGYQYLDHNVIVSSLYEVFKTTDDCYDRFLWYWFKTKTFSKMIEQLQEGGVRLYFYYDKLCMCSIKMPDIAEQIRIAEYFEKLDKLISSCSKELDKLQSLKKGLLEKLFV